MFEDKQIPTSIETKFLRLFINNTLSWKIHIEYINTKLSSACYAMRSVKPYVSLIILKMIYYSCFHSVMSYDLLFWGHSSDSMQIFRLQKKIIRIMTGCRRIDTCRKFFFKFRNINTLFPAHLRQVLRYITLTLCNMLIFTNLTRI